MTSSLPHTIVHLGLQAELAYAELEAVLGEKPLKITRSFVTVPADKATPERMARLAGAVRYGSMVAENVAGEDLITAVADALGDMRRPEFVLNVAGHSMTPKFRESIALSVKKELRARGVSSRWVSGPDLIASSVLVAKQGVLAKGAEITCIKNAEGKYTLMRTSRVQDFEEWSEQDFGRPQRDAKRGMLPPKLARMMLNIAIGSRSPSEVAVCDPFCGVGTVVTEAMRLGVKAVFASDIDASAVEAARKNIDWLRKESGSTTEVVIRAGDAHAINSVFPNVQPDVIVTETYLGKPQQGVSESRHMVPVMQQVEAVVRPALRSVSGILTQGGRMVFTLPSWRTIDADVMMLPPDIIPKEVSIAAGFPIPYSREDHVVVRQVYSGSC